MQLRTVGGTAQEHGLAADPRHHNRFARLNDLAGDAFPKSITDTLAGAHGAGRRFELHITAVLVQQDDGAADRPMMPAEDFEHALECFVQVKRRGQRLTCFKQGRELADFARMRGVWFRPV